MTIQDLPSFYQMRCSAEDGNMSGEFYLYLDQTFQALNAAMNLLNSITSTIVNQGTVTVNGVNVPSFTTAQIATLNADDTIPLGTIWYDNELGKLKFKGNTLQTITSTP